MELDEFLKALADPNRMRIYSLLEGRTLCVCDLESILGLNQSNLSRHLGKLRYAGLVQAQKRGLFMYYSRKPLDERFSEVVRGLDALVHSTQPWWESDQKLLASCSGCEVAPYSSRNVNSSV